MSIKKSKSGSGHFSLSSISALLGAAPVLPGESQADYQTGLLATVQELGATTPLQVYLAEKIFECMCWMRRYENQKRSTLILRMATLLDVGHHSSSISDLQAWAADALYVNRIDEDFKRILDKRNLTIDTLKQKAMEGCRQVLENFDQLIALNAKTLAGFQASFEVLVNRRVNAERLRLQNALMQRDLGAIEANSNKLKKIERTSETGQ